MKPNTKYPAILQHLYRVSANIVPPGLRSMRRIVCATPSLKGINFTAETNDYAPRTQPEFFLCGRPSPNRRIAVFVFADGSVIIHIQRAVRLLTGLRAVMFNRFSLRSAAGRMLGDMLMSDLVEKLRGAPAK